MDYLDKISQNTQLSRLIYLNFELLAITQRFNINLGIGDKTIREVCELHKINPDFFLEIVNIFHNKNIFFYTKLQSFSIKLIIDFLMKSHIFYNEEKIPYIENLIEKLYWKSEDHDRNYEILKKFFYEYKTEVKEHTMHEEKIVYPYALFIEETFDGKQNLKECSKKMKKYSITNYAQEHENIEEKLTDLKNIIIKHLPPPENQKIINKILVQLFRLEKDLNNHARIEEKILVPKIMEMEGKLKTKFNFNL